MRIIVDGDACPGISIIEKIAKKYEAELVVYCDIYHNIELDYGDVKKVDKGFQSVDMYVVNKCVQDDIVISQDYGVAAMCLGKKAYVISPKGYIYSNNNIDKLLFERHLNVKARKGGYKTSNPKKRVKEDDDRLEVSIESIIKKLV
jgi:uncharacterized protein YaiI (UPF0178 family)